MPLEDSYKRQINYLRLSVTDHCNYKCFYCRPADDEAGSLSHEFLTADEIGEIVRIFTELGVRKVRLTGGEPLLRKDIGKIVKLLGSLPELHNLSLSTNAHLLAKFAIPLKESGLNRVNISLDSLNKTRFGAITRGGELSRVLIGIDAAVIAGLNPVKINMVVMRGKNEDEIEDMLDYAINRNIELRFIETMPVGASGNKSLNNFYPADKILTRVQAHLRGSLIEQSNMKDAGPARIYKIKGTDAKVGVISALSQHFCATCNRVRLTAKGRLIPCLGQEQSVSLRNMIRENMADDKIKRLIIKTILNKPERHDFIGSANMAVNSRMVKMGG